MIKLHFESGYRGSSEYRISGGSLHGRRIAVRGTTIEHHAKFFGSVDTPREARLIEAELDLCGTISPVGRFAVTREVAEAAQALHAGTYRKLAEANMEPEACWVKRLEVMAFDPATGRNRRREIEDLPSETALEVTA